MMLYSAIHCYTWHKTTHNTQIVSTKNLDLADLEMALNEHGILHW